jgi:1-acyl-sn-glycerol-3-phosphate acyltransferase
LKSPDRKREFGYFLSARLTHSLLKAVTRVELSGIEHVPLSGAAILAGNHISHFDPYYVGPPVPRAVDFMAMEEFFRVPVVGAWLRWTNVFPVRRATDGLAAREAIRRLKRERLVAIFPERGLRAGATSLLGGAAMPKGTMALAHRLGVPVVPCVILGSDRLYQWRDWFKRITVWIRYGPALRPSQSEPADDFQNRYEKSMRSIYNDMIRDYRLTEIDLPQNPQRRKGKDPR